MKRCALAVALALLVPARAHAYLDSAQFDAPVLEGGGGGRTFSGAPADGYTCGVCHRGGGEPAIGIEGIPIEGWNPGATYELVITLPDITRNSGAVIEIADAAGAGAGGFAVPAEAELEESDRCRTSDRATSVVPVPSRLVARTEVCGATRARVLWTAPATIPEDLRLFVVTVAGNDSSDPEGDGVTRRALPLVARGAPPADAGRLEQRCSVLAAGAGARPPVALLVLLALVTLRKKR